MRPFPPQEVLREKNKGREEIRTLSSKAITAEQACFPGARQAGRLTRKIGKSRQVVVELLSSRSREELGPKGLMKAVRKHWVVEAGVHYRLDLSLGEDRSRVRHRGSHLVQSMIRRFVISLFAEWKTAKPRKRKHKSLPDFLAVMEENDQKHAFVLVTAKRPKVLAK